MIQGKITGIGSSAIGQEPLIILFSQQANETDELKNHVVIQEIETPSPEFNLAAGNTISFDEQMYQVAFVGPEANRNLSEINHAVMLFTEVPDEDFILNGVYLTPHQLPDIAVGTKITYH